MPDNDESQPFEAFINAVIAPLLQKSDADVKLLQASDDEVVFEVSGAAGYGVGSHYVRTMVLEPAARKYFPNAAVRYEKRAHLPEKNPAS